jgi:hypothetical protein
MGLIYLGLLAGIFAALVQTLIFIYVPSQSRIHFNLRFHLVNLIFVLFSLRFVKGWAWTEFILLAGLVWALAVLMLVLLVLFDLLQGIDREQAAKQ